MKKILIILFLITSVVLIAEISNVNGVDIGLIKKINGILYSDIDKLNSIDFNIEIDISEYSYTGQSFALTRNGTPSDFFIGDSGTKLYVFTDGDSIDQYTISYDASSLSVSYLYSANISSVDQKSTFTISNNGDNLYVLDYLYKKIKQYDISTSWNISTALYHTQYTFQGSEMPGYGVGIILNEPNEKLIVGDYNNSGLKQFSIPTLDDISTISYDEAKYITVTTNIFNSFSYSHNHANFIITLDNDVTEWTTNNKNNISTITDKSISVDFSTQDTGCLGIRFGNIENAFLMLGSQNKTIYLYSK